MNKARLMSLLVSLSLLAFYLQGFAHVLGSSFGHPQTWYDGH
jgi:hypothetical protein